MSNKIHATSHEDWEMIEFPEELNKTQSTASGEQSGHRIAPTAQHLASQLAHAISDEQRPLRLSAAAHEGLGHSVTAVNKAKEHSTSNTAEELLWKQCEDYKNQEVEARVGKKNEEAHYWGKAYIEQLKACLVDPSSSKQYAKIAECWAAAAKYDAKSDQKALREKKTGEGSHLAEAARYSVQAAENLTKGNTAEARKFEDLAKESALKSETLQKDWVRIKMGGD